MPSKEWRKAHPETRNRHRRDNYARGRNPRLTERSGDAWEDWEIEILLDASPRYLDRGLALLLRRSIQSLQVKRSRLRAAKRKAAQAS